MNEKPVYLLAGGRFGQRLVPDPLIQAVVRESGKLSPTIGYLGSANDDDKGFLTRTSDLFRQSGTGKVSLAATCSKNASISKAKDILESADIVFVGGGGVEEGIQLLQEKNMIDFLQALYRQGKPFFGISAGSIMLAREWVRWRDPDDDTSAELFPCLDIAGVICDTHDEQGGWEELRAALKLKEDNARGFGIVSGTAIKVFPDGRVEAVGGAIHQYARRGERVERIDDILPATGR